MNEQYKYTVDPTASEPIMLLNGDIGGAGIDGARFQSELLRLDSMGKKVIKVYINSPGGAVSDGMAIYHAITRTKAKVDTYNVGLCASVAAVIFQAGRKRVMADYSVLMFHAASGEDKAGVSAMNDALAIMIARSGLSKAAVDKLIHSGDTFLDSKQALQMSLTDEIESSATQNLPHGNTKIAALYNGQQHIHRLHGQANTLNIMAAIAAKHNQKS